MTNIPWGKLDFTDSNVVFSPTETLSVEILRRGSETIIFKHTENGTSESRFITGSEPGIYLEPGLPGLPIILKPSQSISILPAKKLEVYIEIPFVVRIFCGSKQKKTDLAEIELNTLSKSFFGSSESGEFAYFLESQMHCDISDYSKQSQSIYCPLMISNRSDQKLEFEKMIFRVPYLSIYRKKSHLIASPVTITFRGQEQISQIEYKKAPHRNEDAELMSPPRQVEDKNLLKRSFYFIKNLYTG